MLSARPGSFHTASEPILFAAICFFIRPITLIAVVLTVAAALAVTALFGIGTANAGFTPLFCPVQIKYYTAHYTQKNHNDYKIHHADLHTAAGGTNLS